MNSESTPESGQARNRSARKLASGGVAVATPTGGASGSGANAISRISSLSPRVASRPAACVASAASSPSSFSVRGFLPAAVSTSTARCSLTSSASGFVVWRTVRETS